MTQLNECSDEFCPVPEMKDRVIRRTEAAIVELNSQIGSLFDRGYRADDPSVTTLQKKLAKQLELLDQWREVK